MSDGRDTTAGLARRGLMGLGAAVGAAGTAAGGLLLGRAAQAQTFDTSKSKLY